MCYKEKRMNMQLFSTQNPDEDNASKILKLEYDSIFDLGYNNLVKSLLIASAFTDVDFIDEVITKLTQSQYTNNPTLLKIYLDKNASRFNTSEDVKNKLVKCARRIKDSRNFFTKDSGIYLVSCGALFHSKFIISKSNTKSKVFLGSINFTRKAFEKNEEIAISFETKTKPKSSNDVDRLISYLERYVDNLPVIEKVEKSLSSSYHKSFASLQEMFLNGALYRVIKEQDPFRIQLNLPKEYLEDLKKRKKTDVDENDPSWDLEGDMANSLSLAKIIEKTNLPNKPDYFDKRKNDDHISWKKFSIECSLGYWVPNAYKNYVQQCFSFAIEKKQKLERLANFISKDENAKELKNVFISRIQNMQNDIKNTQWKQDWSWSTFNNDKIAEEWDKWMDRLMKKLTSDKYEKFREKLCCGVSPFCVPDLWDDPVSSEEFEQSVNDSIRYFISTKDRVCRKLCNGVNQSINKKNKDIDDIGDDELLRELLNYVNFLEFRTRCIEMYANYKKKDFFETDELLSRYIEDYYDELIEMKEAELIRDFEENL